MAEILARLEAEYCPPLDSALLSAILSDFDLSKVEDVEAARGTLDVLKETAIAEELDGFDASGTGGLGDDASVARRPESCPDTSTTQSKETDATSVSSQLGRLDVNEAESTQNVNAINADDLEQLDQGTKVELLKDVFGDRVTTYGIEHTLKKCKGNWNSAMEELLNHVYFNETNGTLDDERVSAKGVDAFAEEHIIKSGRKSRPKKKHVKNGQHRRSSSLPGLSDGDAIPTTNKWKSSADDVEFISSRIGIPTSTVSSIYYEKGASVSQTIAALLKASMETSKLLGTDETMISANAQQLGRDFPTISPDYLATLLRLTHPSTTAAHELAEALTSKPKNLVNGGIQIVPRSNPVNLSDGFENATNGKAKTPVRSRSPSSDLASPSIRRDTYALARSAAFAQASAAHRKAKSDRLMGGAAAYYGQVGRDYVAMSANASAEAADQLAHSQSNSTQLDLHGVDVLNAVRIAKERVEGWWSGLGESRVNGRVGAVDRQMGYRIVVGLGRHSESGKGKLGPAVSKALREEGWKIEVAGPVIVVKGPVRK